MRKLVLAAFLVSCILAYPQENNFDITFDEIIHKNLPTLRKELTNRFHPSEEEWGDIIKICQPSGPDDSIQDNVNACIDKLFSIIDTLLMKYVDPLPLQDLHAGFNYTLIITYHGELDLTNGKLRDLYTIHRNGDAKFSYDLFHQTATVGFGIAFNDLAFTYDYSAKIMNIGPRGGIEGSVTDLTLDLELGFDFKNKVLTVGDFHIDHSGNIKFKFTGHAVVDWLLNLLTDLVTSLMKKVIIGVMDDVVGGAIKALVQAINDYFKNHTIPAYEVTTAYYGPGYNRLVKYNIE